MKIIKSYFSIIGEVIGLVIGLLVIIYILPLLPFITDDYPLWQPIAVYTTIASALIKIFKHIFGKPLSFGFEALSTIPGMYSTWKLLEIFPLDFGLVGYGEMNQVFRFALHIALAALVLALLINIVKFLSSSEGKKK